MRGLAWLVLLLLAAGCRSRPAEAAPESCAPSTAALHPSLPAVSLAGAYRVRLVATAGPRRDSSTEGRLELVAPAEPDSGSRRPALVGTGNLRLEEIGAPSADLDSRDPDRPGVVVFDLPPSADTTNAPRVLLRLGAEANRRDVVRLEGASTVLRVREVRPDGFIGDWTAHAPLPVAEGYFCAWRVGAGE